MNVILFISHPGHSKVSSRQRKGNQQLGKYWAQFDEVINV